jgi:hypothetical protein
MIQLTVGVMMVVIGIMMHLYARKMRKDVESRKR